MSTGLIHVGPRGRTALVAIALAAIGFSIIAIARSGDNSPPVDVDTPITAVAPKAPNALDLAERAGAVNATVVFPPPLLTADAADASAPVLHVVTYTSNDARDAFIATARDLGVELPMISGDRWTIQTEPGNVINVIRRVGGRLAIDVPASSAP